MLPGFTSVADFPTFGPAQAAFHGGTDAFVAKLAPSQSQTSFLERRYHSRVRNRLGRGAYHLHGPRDQPGIRRLDPGVFLSDQLDTGTAFVSASVTPISTPRPGSAIGLRPRRRWPAR